jgi:hypothetical protein
MTRPLSVTESLEEFSQISPNSLTAFLNKRQINIELLSSGTWHRLLRWKSTNVSEEHFASIIRAEEWAWDRQETELLRLLTLTEQYKATAQ